MEKRCQRRPNDDVSEIPIQYLELLELEIFRELDLSNSIPLELWEKFARWAGFEKSPNFRKKFRHHCRRLWTKTKHAYELQLEAQKNPLELYKIPEVFQRSPSEKLFIADETTKKVAAGSHLNGYNFVSKPQCFKNAVGETMIDFFDLPNFLATKTAQETVDGYFNHTLSNTSHQSPQFKESLAEHFGCFTDSNNEPYVTINTAFTHSKDHRNCVEKLIQGLQPLSDEVNNYLEVTYPLLYAKMKKLDLGPNVPKSFGAFPTVGINFNSICQFHRDLKDHRNTFCVVCPLGVFEGGQLAFPELKLAFNVKQGQAIAFRSNLLVHGNLPITTGTRHSVVFYIHDTVIKQKRKFGSLYDKKGKKYYKKHSPSKLVSRKSATKLKNHRRKHIGKCDLYIYC